MLKQNPDTSLIKHTSSGVFNANSLVLFFWPVGFEVRTFAKPAACSAFEWEDLEACTEDLGVETGCCKKECSAILEKVEWSSDSSRAFKI